MQSPHQIGSFSCSLHQCSPWRSARLLTALLAVSVASLLVSWRAQGQAELVADRFSMAPKIVGEPVVFSHGGTDELCFNGEDVVGQEELFCYDGSSLQQVADINPLGSSNPSDLTIYDDGSGAKLYFRANDGSSGDELWVYDGSTVNQVADINTGSGGSLPNDLTVYNDGSGSKLYFSADDGSNGDELWSYNGSVVDLEVDINASGGSYPGDLTVYDDGGGAKLYFRANDGADEEQLWSYDGSSANLEASFTETFGSFPRYLTVYDDGSGAKLYFQANDGSNGEELWSYDGSSVTLEADINGSGDSSPRYLTVYDDGSGAKLYFRADDGTNGYELWSYDGVDAVLEADINDSGQSRPRYLTVYDDGSGARLYFRADDGSSGTELWSYDGVDAVLEADINDFGYSSPFRLTVYNDGSGAKLYFSAYPSHKSTFNRKRRLHAHSATGTSLASVPRNLNDVPTEKAVYDGRLYFSADDGSSGEELWVYDGSSISLVEDINTGIPGSSPTDLTVYDDGSGSKLYFKADDGNSGRELWAYDGSSVSQAADIHSGSSGSNPEDLTVYDDGSGAKLYFSADDGNSGDQLWSYDGSNAAQETSINSGSFSGLDPEHLTVYDDGSGAKLYFRANDGSSGRELWSYDGSNASLEADIDDSGSSAPAHLTVYNDGGGAKLYFSADDGSSGRELWSYNGSSPSQVGDLISGPDGSAPQDLISFEGNLYFTARTSAEGREPSAYDGSTITTEDLYSGSFNGGGFDPVVYDDGSGAELYVTGTDGQSGGELYRFGADDGPLPVELASFESVRTGESDIKLTWRTASEQNNAGFQVQHKRGGETGETWKRIGFVESKAEGGTASTAQSYRFTAEDLAVGTHRFRLKQVDVDGTSHLHEPVTVELQMEEALRLGAPAPNPIREQATVSFAVKEAKETTVTLYNVLGQKVATLYEGTPQTEEQKTLRVDGGELSSGVYLLRLEAGGQTRTERLTVVQ